MLKSRVFSLLTALPALALATSPAAAQSVEEFYRGKTITMAVGTSPGGDYDLRMRMVSRHIGKHIPGNPTVIATNMPGAGQMLVANWLASVAPKDGTVIVALSQNMAVNQATGASGVKYDVRQFNWIGNTTDSPNVINAWHTTGIKHHPGRDAARVGGRRYRDRQRLLSLSVRAQPAGRHQVQDRHRLSGRQ